jgi:hypothetical protein
MNKKYLLCLFVIFLQPLFFNNANCSYNLVNGGTLSKLRLRLHVTHYITSRSCTMPVRPSNSDNVVVEYEDRCLYLDFKDEYDNVTIEITHDEQTVYSEFIITAKGQMPVIEIPNANAGDYEVNIINNEGLNLIGEFVI